MDVWGNRTIDQILFVYIYIHVCDRPANLLCMNFANLLPVVWVLGVEKDNVGLTGTII